MSDIQIRINIDSFKVSDLFINSANLIPKIVTRYKSGNKYFECL